MLLCFKALSEKVGKVTHSGARTAILTIATCLFIIWSTCIKGSADTQGKPGAAFEPGDEAENSREHVNGKLPITGPAAVISTIFFPLLSTQVRVQEKMNSGRV